MILIFKNRNELSSLNCRIVCLFVCSFCFLSFYFHHRRVCSLFQTFLAIRGRCRELDHIHESLLWKSLDGKIRFLINLFDFLKSRSLIKKKKRKKTEGSLFNKHLFSILNSNVPETDVNKSVIEYIEVEQNIFLDWKRLRYIFTSYNKFWIHFNIHISPGYRRKPTMVRPSLSLSLSLSLLSSQSLSFSFLSSFLWFSFFPMRCA